jgi:hypothetical protein
MSYRMRYNRPGYHWWLLRSNSITLSFFVFFLSRRGVRGVAGVNWSCDPAFRRTRCGLHNEPGVRSIRLSVHEIGHFRGQRNCPKGVSFRKVWWIPFQRGLPLFDGITYDHILLPRLPLPHSHLPMHIPSCLKPQEAMEEGSGGPRTIFCWLCMCIECLSKQALLRAIACAGRPVVQRGLQSTAFMSRTFFIGAWVRIPREYLVHFVIYIVHLCYPSN